VLAVLYNSPIAMLCWTRRRHSQHIARFSHRNSHRRSRDYSV